MRRAIDGGRHAGAWVRVAACALPLLAGCGGGDAPQPAAAFADPGHVEAGDARLHYALTPTLDLPSEIAGSYGIVQRRNLALLTIAIRARDGRPGDANVLEAAVISLTGRRQPVALARHDAAAVPTWLATVPIGDREPVTIEIRARARASGPEITARFTRRFHFGAPAPSPQMP